MAKHLIELKNITKTFDDTEVLKNINLYINENEFLTLLGPSGCGKSTLLRLIAGFEVPTSGEIFFEDKDLSGVEPYERKVNTVFQRYALFPHLNVFDNIAFGLKIKNMDSVQIKNKVKKVLELVNLEGFEERSIDSLSGGQQQRIAIARAIVNEPKVLLLDEPLAALDLKLRKGMQLELKNMQKELGITFLYVTHDQE
ncbi:MAG: ATP-binding cassette domain-containing protein, partial [Clostridia bacterium]|nr:ATP-binding cassette domain-containing protein [Clostridia bacterium]